MVNNADGHDCQIFVSHSGHQKLVADGLFKHLAEILRDRPTSAIFFDRSVASIPMGARIFKNIETAIKSCKVGVLIISPSFFESYWPMRELELLVERTQEEDPISLYPIFYDTRDINKDMKSETASLDKWKKTWKAFKEGVANVQKWAQYVVEVKEMRGKILSPNETVELELYNMAMEIAEMLPSSLSAPRPLPSPPSQANYSQILDLEIRKQNARCQYTTYGSLILSKNHVSFYLQPREYNALQDNHRPKPCLFGQRPEPGGSPNESREVETLLFTDLKQTQANTRPIGAGNEWWECIWTDRGQVVYRDDHSCWRVKTDKIPQGYVCLSPYFFKIDTLENRMNHSSANFLVLKEDYMYMPPSSEKVQGMVAINEKLVTYVTGERLKKVWEDRGSRVTEPLAIYTGPDLVGCFAFTTYDQPTGGSYPILDRSKFH